MLLGAYFMAFNRACFILGAWLFIIVSGPASGQTGAGETGAVSRPWMFGLSVQADDLDMDSRYATFNWHVTEETWIYFSGGTSHFKNSFGELTTNSFLAGFDRQIGQFGFSLDGERWGDSEEVESTDVRATAHFGGERYRLYLELEDRQIHLSPSLPDRVDLDVDGAGIGLRMRVNLTDRLSLSLRGINYDYEWSAPTLQPVSPDLRPTSQPLKRQKSLASLCTKAVTLINRCSQVQNFVKLLEQRDSYVQSTLAYNSFLDSELSLNMEWQVGTKLLNFNVTKSRAIDLDRSESQSIGASILFPINSRVDMEFSLGRSEFDLYEPSTYGGVFFLIYGG